MPELPEVTTIKTGLNKKVKGLTIKDVWTDWAKLIKNSSFDNFKKEVIGKKIVNSERIGKNILMRLSGGTTIIFHMKMTGHFLYGKWIQKIIEGKEKCLPKEEGPLCDPYNRFIHVLFHFTDGNMLALSDMRKFAKITIEKTADEKESAEINKLGPDPLEIDFKKFKELLSKKPNGKIKQTLVDQEIISGIGNIYSDEILWAAGVHPLEKIKNIPEAKLKKMFEATNEILSDSIKHGGDSMSDFRNINGEKGEYQKFHKAYRQTGKPCPKKDGGKIVRIKIGGRSAHFCDVHQRLNS